MVENENNYEEYHCTMEQSLTIRNMCLEIVKDKDPNCQKRMQLVDYFRLIYAANKDAFKRPQ